MKFRQAFILAAAIMLAVPANAQEGQAQGGVSEDLDRQFENLDHRLDQLEKAVDDVLWYHKVGDVAHIDKVYSTGPPPWKEDNPTAMGYGNPVKF